MWGRLARRLFTIIPALSLLLCAAVAALWVRSYRVAETVQWASGEGRRALASNRGSVSLASVAGPGAQYVRKAGYHAQRASAALRPPVAPEWVCLGIRSYSL